MRQAFRRKERAKRRGNNHGLLYTKSQIVERDGTTCRLCLMAVDMTLAHPDPLSASVDHVLPLSLGGADAFDNVQLAHLVCNVRKGNRVYAPSEEVLRT